MGTEEAAQESIEATPQEVPIASYIESEERETKDESRDVTEAAVASKTEEPWAHERAAPQDTPIE